MSDSAATTPRPTWHRLASPALFQRWAGRLEAPLLIGALGLLAIGLWLGLVASPADYKQSETVRIMYVHVPAAWMSLAIYSAMAVAALMALVWRHALGDILVRAAAPVGAAMTALCLGTGMLWGEPMWGTWWVWDARLTSVLILFFFYLGYIALANAFDDPVRGDRSGAVLLLVGAVNVPIVKFSVDWWHTLHQPASVFRFDGPTIDAAMLWPLAVMALAFTLLGAWLVVVRMQAELAQRKRRALMLGRQGQ